ncbi:LppU/SCO3897 family protein [Nocardioides antri]|uniref:Uncharacterized protein n=1 Tax=Nocardioides antri TaxID=2607659 RepID=A0A5B1M2H1_9ACTN|nr:hypothetical protein [Nocardioides antri]KAA1427395.1 hypothetical protein F0U47_07920 [Nocardioides antri]
MATSLGGGMLRRFIGIGVAIAIALGWWAFGSFRASSGAPEVGECVTVGGSTTDAEVEEAECGGDDVLYKVVADDGACDVIEVNYTVSVSGKDAVDLCLEWEVEPGDCVKVGTDKDDKVDCASAKGDTDVVKVVSVEDGASRTCAKKNQLARANKTRDQLICVVPNV